MSFISKFAKIANSVDNFITGGSITKSFINSRIKEYGKVIDLKIDNQKKVISVKAQLNGEESPVTVEVTDYELSSGSIEIKKISSDRAWVNAVVTNFVEGKSFKLPEKSIEFINEFLG